MTTRCRVVLTLCGLALFAGRPLSGQAIRSLDGPWQPVVLEAVLFPELQTTRVDWIRLYAYRSGAGSGVWELIPFQIDEKDTDDYFDPHNGFFDGYDQLVFMARDMGDQAAEDAWIDNPESVRYPRYEIEIADGGDTSRRAWVYLYVSPSFSGLPPSPYGMFMNATSNPDTEWVETLAYAAGFNRSGFLGAARVKQEGGGSGVDLLDTQKLRMVGYVRFGPLAFSVGKGGNPPLNERDFFRMEFDSTRVLAGPVRIVRREWIGMMLFGAIPLPVGFPLTTYFYPFSCGFGGSIDSTKLPPDVVIKADLIRQSFDLSPAAQGMQFHNPDNHGLVVDGAPDAAVTAVTVPGLNWAMVTGAQGTLLTVTWVPNLGARQALYYWDNASGGSADSTHTNLQGGDTGDGASYGDFGYLFEGEGFPLSLSFEFTCYFLPSYQPDSVGKVVKQWAEQGVVPTARAQTYPTGVQTQGGVPPSRYALHPNFPNPFNAQTVIWVELPAGVQAQLEIVDASARAVRSFSLRGQDAGSLRVVWDGRDQRGSELPSGLYLAVLRGAGLTMRQKMLLLR